MARRPPEIVSIASSRAMNASVFARATFALASAMTFVKSTAVAAFLRLGRKGLGLEPLKAAPPLPE
jgi:hypothetical protein